MSKLVLLPGLDGTGRFFWRLERELAGRVPLQVVSYPPDPLNSYEELSTFVRSNLKDEAVVLLGESFSGPIAVNVAASAPRQVKGLILAATFLKSPWPSWIVRAAAKTNLDRVPHSVISWVLRGHSKDAELAALLTDVLANFRPDVRATRLHAVAEADVAAAFRRVTCPILALHGNNDWLVPKSSVEKAVMSHPASKMKILDGPHMLLQRNAAAAAFEIESFMQSIQG